MIGLKKLKTLLSQVNSLTENVNCQIRENI